MIFLIYFWQSVFRAILPSESLGPGQGRPAWPVSCEILPCGPSRQSIPRRWGSIQAVASLGDIVGRDISSNFFRELDNLPCKQHSPNSSTAWSSVVRATHQTAPDARCWLASLSTRHKHAGRSNPFQSGGFLRGRQPPAYTHDEVARWSDTIDKHQNQRTDCTC